MKANAEDVLTFYRAIFGDAPTEVRLIHPDGRPPRHSWGAAETVADLETLERMNAKGWGVFAVINRCDTTVEARCKASRGARDEDITGIRAVFVDFDGEEATPGANLARLEAAPLPPSLVACSSLPHKLHAYWLMADLPVSEFEGVQKGLAAYFGSDPTICNPARVMRVPGFIHTKGEPVLSRLLACPGHTYTRAEVLEGFAIKLEPPKPVQPPRAPVTVPADADRLRRYALSALEREADTLAGMSEGNRNNRLNRAAFVLATFIPHGLLERHEIEDALTGAAKKCGLGKNNDLEGAALTYGKGEIPSTIKSGIEAGLKEARKLPRPLYKAKVTITHRGNVYARLRGWR